MTPEPTTARLPEGADDVAIAAEPSDKRYNKKGKLKSAVYEEEMERPEAIHGTRRRLSS